MARPKFLAKLRDVLTSLLLALAVSLAWPAMSAPHDQHAHTSKHHLAEAHSHGAAHEHANHAPAPACTPDLGCCVMTHCHPGVAEPLFGMPREALFPRHDPLAPTDEAGVDPVILVPPPRLLLG